MASEAVKDHGNDHPTTQKKRKHDCMASCCWDGSREDMDRDRMLFTEQCHSSSLLSEESSVVYCSSNFSRICNREGKSHGPAMQALTSGAHHSESNSAAFFLWPPSANSHGTPGDRAEYFNGLQKKIEPLKIDGMPTGRQATTLLDLMSIRAFHSKDLCCLGLGTAVGFRTRKGIQTEIPAIIVFVPRKVHKEWLHDVQRIIPQFLEGPGGVWCDVDVVEFSYYGTSAVSSNEPVHTELVEGLRGDYPFIGPGSQVASQEAYGTLGAIVQSKIGEQQVGFLTNRQVAINLDFPSQKMFHPLPPNVGQGVYLGAVERATSFVTDELWYGIFASMSPETYIRADGAFIPFHDSFDILSKVTTVVEEVGEMGDVMFIDLQAPIDSIVGKQVMKVGRGSGLTKGIIMAYAFQCNDEKGSCFSTDFLIVGESQQGFDSEGDSGSLILLIGDENEKPRPVGIIWGGTGNPGRLKLHSSQRPKNWTSGVALGSLLELLQLNLITNNDALREAVEQQMQWRAGYKGRSLVGDLLPKIQATTNEERSGEVNMVVDSDLPAMFGSEVEEFGRVSVNHNDNPVSGPLPLVVDFFRCSSVNRQSNKD